MDLIQSIILGITQGITEFLPISSSAHLILISKFSNFPDQGLLFDVAVHFGSILAVIIYFYQDFLKMLKGFKDLINKKKSQEYELFLKLTISTIPILILGLLLKNYAETIFRENIMIIAITSIVWGILLFLADKRKTIIENNNKITYKKAFLIGVAQAFAIIPGTSRSGATITMARFLNISRKVSTEFSMLMSIPIILLITITNFYEIFTSTNFVSFNLEYLFVGIATSFIFALLSIHFLIKFISKSKFLPFAVYRIILGIIILYTIF